jgi:hypothetical protein
VVSQNALNLCGVECSDQLSGGSEGCIVGSEDGDTLGHSARMKAVISKVMGRLAGTRMRLTREARGDQLG